MSLLYKDKIKANLASSIRPQKQAYYDAILSAYPKVVSKGQPLIYIRPVGPVTMYYLKKALEKNDTS